MPSRFPSPEMKAALERAEHHVNAAVRELEAVRSMAHKSRAKDAPFLAAAVWREALNFTEKASYLGRLSLIGR